MESFSKPSVFHVLLMWLSLGVGICIGIYAGDHYARNQIQNRMAWTYSATNFPDCVTGPAINDKDGQKLKPYIEGGNDSPLLLQPHFGDEATKWTPDFCFGAYMEYKLAIDTVKEK